MIENNPLELALQRNRMSQQNKRVSHLLPIWLAKLAKACNCKVSSENHLSLEETRRLKTAFFQRAEQASQRSTCLHHFWPHSNFENVEALLRDVGISVGQIRVILFSSVDSEIGTVSLPADAVLSNPKAIWDVVEEDLAITTPSLQDGLRLEFNFYSEEGEYIKEGLYELTAWGIFVPQRYPP